MRFPERERVLYASNPLDDVVCQIFFPRILAIENELPVDFQNSLIADYPFLGTQESPMVTGSMEAAGEDATPTLVYEFSSLDKSVTVALSSRFLGVRAEKYERWENFRKHIEKAIGTLLKHYKPAVFTRTMLRYVNHIHKDSVGLNASRWNELIRPSLLGPLADPDIPEECLENQFSISSFQIDGGKLQIVSGLLSGGRTAYLIDNLFSFDESSDPDGHKSLGILDRFNAESGRVFRWCIKDGLHTALRPAPVSS